MGIIDLIIVIILFFILLVIAVAIQEQLNISEKYNPAILIICGIVSSTIYVTFLILFV